MTSIFNHTSPRSTVQVPRSPEPAPNTGTAAAEPAHTPEKWEVAGRQPENHAINIVNGKGFLVAQARAAGGGWSDAKANAARIVACVNACAGMADPAAEIARMRAALEGIAILASCAPHDDEEKASREFTRIMHEARAALKGGA